MSDKKQRAQAETAPASASAPADALDENKIVAERRAKLAKLREEGFAYPNDFARDQMAEKLESAYGELSAEALEANPVAATVAGHR